MLDKNPDQGFEKLNEVKQVVDSKILNLVISNEAFIKTGFLARLIENIRIPITYIDFDFLYSGYISTGIVKQKDNVSVFQPTRADFEEILKRIISKVTQEKTVVIIDSFNGIFALYDEKDSGRLVNTFFMLLVNSARYSDSRMIIACVAKHVEEGWILTPSGRHILDVKDVSKIYLSRKEEGILFQLLDNKNTPIKTVLITQN